MANRVPRPRSSNAVPTAAQLNDLLGYRINRLSAAMGQQADRDARSLAGLTLAEYRVCAVLLLSGPQGVAALQQITLIDKAWISRTLTRLTKKAMVRGRADPDDGRRTSFELTAKGQRAASTLIDQSRKRQAGFLRGVSPAERAVLIELLERVQRNIEGNSR